MSITSITIDGTGLDLADVEYSVVIYHGRNDISSSPTPSSAQLSLFITGAPNIPVHLSQALVIQAYNVDRFTGVITDLDLEHTYSQDGEPMTVLTMVAIGALSKLGSFYDAASGFPAEPLDDRLATILGNTGLPSVVDADPGIDLIAYPAGAQTVDQLLLELAVWTGGTMYDTPSGEIWWESYTRRGLTYSNATWSDELYTWTNTPGTWDTQLEAGAAATVVLPSGSVAWAPSWQATQQLILNDVTVTYGTSDPQLTENIQDAASIARYGTRSLTIETGLSDSADAQDRAQAVITSQSQERWQLGKVEVLVDDLDDSTRTAVLALQAGSRVLVTDLPQPGPIDEFYGVVEGWGETYTREGHRLVLSLSDPRFSLAMCSWAEAPSDATWSGIPNTNSWADIVVPSDLAA